MTAETNEQLQHPIAPPVAETVPQMKRPLPILPTPGERSLGQLLYETLHGQVEGMKPLCGEPYANILPESIARYEHAAAIIARHATKEVPQHGVPEIPPAKATVWPRYWNTKDDKFVRWRQLSESSHVEFYSRVRGEWRQSTETTLSISRDDDGCGWIETDAEGNALPNSPEIPDSSPSEHPATVPNCSESPNGSSPIADASWLRLRGWIEFRGSLYGPGNLSFDLNGEPQQFWYGEFNCLGELTQKDIEEHEARYLNGIAGPKDDRKVVASTCCEPISSQPGNVNLGVTVHCGKCGTWTDDVTAGCVAANRQELLDSSPSREWISKMADGEDRCASVSARNPDAIEQKQDASGVEEEPIDRWKHFPYSMKSTPDGDFVTKADHDAAIAELRAEQLTLARDYDPNCDEFDFAYQREVMKSASRIIDAAQGLAQSLGRDPEGCLVTACECAVEVIDERDILKEELKELRTRAEAAEAKCAELEKRCAEVQNERERADRVTHVVLSSLKWTGDGYEWTGGRYDYRMNPSEAVAATMNEFNRLTAQLAAANDKLLVVEAERDGLREALKDLVDDICERVDMQSPSTNPGMKVAVKNAQAALASLSQQNGEGANQPVEWEKIKEANKWDNLM